MIFWFDRASDNRGASKVCRHGAPRSAACSRPARLTGRTRSASPRCVWSASKDASSRSATLDLLDGTPVLDLKPYLAYADAFPDASAGWLETQHDPRPSWTVAFATRAEEQLAWLEEQGVDPRGRIAQALALGPQPHAYRRIKNGVLAVKEWRARFVRTGEQALTVIEIFSGFRTKDAPPLHRAFAARFG